MYKRDPVLSRVHVYLRIVRATRPNPSAPLLQTRAPASKYCNKRRERKGDTNMTRVFYSLVEICILGDWNFEDDDWK